MINICGLQKFSLLDYPDKICATVFTPGCNFRCPFCHNPSLAYGKDNGKYLDVEAFFSFLQRRLGQLDAVCLTGGEPLLQSGLMEFLIRIRQLGFLIKLDTNGSFPDLLDSLIQANLVDYVAMDIKNSLERYPETVGMDQPPLAKIQDSVDLLRRSHLDHEFRTTMVREFHSLNEMEHIGKWLAGSSKYYLQTFHDSGDLIANRPLHAFTPEEMMAFQAIASKYIKTVVIRS